MKSESRPTNQNILVSGQLTRRFLFQSVICMPIRPKQPAVVSSGLNSEFRTSPLRPTHAVHKHGSPDLEDFQTPFHPREWTFDLRHQSVLIIFHEVKGEVKVKDNHSNNYNSSWS